MKKLWLRKEDKTGERRVPITPAEVVEFVQAGVEVTVERCNQRCYTDADYEAAGALLTDAIWQQAPLDTVVLALKELADSTEPVAHSQIHFSHTFKGQEGAKEMLARYARGGGAIYDLEFLFDTQGRRVAAFGYWAGYVGAALGLLGVAHFSKKSTVFPALQPFSDRDALLATVDTALQESGWDDGSLSVLIMGALGRCGSGARDLIASLRSEVRVTAWDLPEFTAADKPIRESLAHELFVNCVYLREPIAPMIDADLLSESGRLKIISDISCDPTSADNPIRVYDAITHLHAPFVRARGEGEAVFVQAIDHLPTLLPRESSQEYAAALFPYLFDFMTSDAPSSTWVAARQRFEQALVSYGLR